MAEIFPWQKWSISYLWEHFLVPEHRIPIWLGFVLGFNVRDGMASMELLLMHCYYIRYYIRYYIPLCLDSKFRNVSQDAAKLIRQVTRNIVRQVIRWYLGR